MCMYILTRRVLSSVVLIDVAMPCSNTHVHVDCACAVEVDIQMDASFYIILILLYSAVTDCHGRGLHSNKSQQKSYCQNRRAQLDSPTYTFEVIIDWS